MNTDNILFLDFSGKNCFDFCHFILVEHFGKNLNNFVDPETLKINCTFNRKHFKKTKDLKDGDLVLGQNSKGGLHCGIFVKNKVLHLKIKKPVYVSIFNFKCEYKKVRFYNVK